LVSSVPHKCRTALGDDEVTRHVLVVGASRGIGLELVRQYREAGDRVVATARSAEGLEQITALGAKALALEVTDLSACAGLAWLLDGEQFDLAWHVAGVIGQRKSAPEAPAGDDFDQVMRTNVLAPMRLLPTLAAALKPGGRLVALSSRMGSMGLRANGSNWLYRASKAALNSVVADLAFGLRGKAVLVAMHPGWVRTDMGGPEGDLALDDAVRRMRNTAAALTPEVHGHFLDLDGQHLAW